MKGKPIFFNSETVQAILGGEKTCTRRSIKRIPRNDEPCGYGFWKEFNKADNNWYIKDYTHSDTWWELKEYINKFGKYHIGDILYVRETWAIQSMSNFDKRVKFVYKALGTQDLETRFVSTEKYEKLLKYECKNGWNPSLSMPKEAARIFLKVTDVRIEKLQDITEEGAKAEGVCGLCYSAKTGEEKYDMTWFKILWDSTVNKKDIEKYGWNKNPYVWVMEFEKINKEEF